MNKFTSLFAVAALALVFPACAKKAAKQEPIKTEQVQEEAVHQTVSNDKESYSV